VANVIRRLKRVASFYGAKPQFILASATIGNPQDLAEHLIEEPVELIDNDGSSRGERHFIIYNPPVTDPALGLRKSALLESVRLTNDLLAHDVQNVVFARTRRSVEIILTYLQGVGEQRAENGDFPADRSPLSSLSSSAPGAADFTPPVDARSLGFIIPPPRWPRRAC
jgi:DEAD/DEAH box helicase domain-containing protein